MGVLKNFGNSLHLRAETTPLYVKFIVSTCKTYCFTL